MNRFAIVTTLMAVWPSCLETATHAAPPAQEVNVVFARDIQPLFARHCLVCHGPDEAEAGLRLDDPAAALALLDSGERAIVPGDADASQLLHRVATDDASLRMPPEGEPLSETEVNLLRQWIEDGARFETHWAYRPVVQPPLPDVGDDAWCQNPIDRFVLSRLQQHGLLPSPEADRATLIKRLSYDMVGLPPSPAEVDAFVNSDRADAYEQLVDRLLASQHFGERWGRHWLDKARYADSDGYEKDRPRPNAWRYRDWVIRAINDDVPFDQFTIEQLAGDLIPEASPLQKLATAFHRQTLTNTEGGVDQEEFRIEATFDRTETTAAVWMGLTMNCARCHAHKYDRISQREYYELFAFFNNANEAGTDVARSEAEWDRYLDAKAAHDEKIAALSSRYEAAKNDLQPEVDRWLEELSNSIAASSPVEFHTVELLAATATSKATFAELDDGSLLLGGPKTDKDEYTLVFLPPAQPLTGIRVETLPDDSLDGKGPGRAPNGNFVLTQLRSYIGDDREFKKHAKIELVTAQADFSQNKFSAEAALATDNKTGWAISPRMGKPHHIDFHTSQPVPFAGTQFLQIVLDQQYGGTHTIGRFRIRVMSGHDPLKSLPKNVAEAVAVEAEKRTDQQRRAIVEHVAKLHPETSQLAKQVEQLRKNAPAPPTLSVRVMTSAERATRVLERGDFLQPSDEVNAGALSVIGRTHPLASRRDGKPADRLDLARWLVHETHPLTSRVTVNDVWARLLGRGLVATVNDFGVRGELPTHPALLDWLAWSFARDMQWSRKTLIKTIVMSATYRQSSFHRPELQGVDPTNRLLARQNRVRVEAEVIRDLHLAVSGLLCEKVGGPSVFPPLPPGVAELSYANNFKWKTSEGDDRYRRGLYTFFKRTSPHPTLISFDCPDSNTARLSRATSNTPLQALITLNNDVFAEAAQAMAARVISHQGDDTRRLDYAMRLCIARNPHTHEIESFRKVLLAAREHYGASPDDAAQLISRHAVDGVDPAENAAWVATIRMILNLDEFIVRD